MFGRKRIFGTLVVATILSLSGCATPTGQTPPPTPAATNVPPPSPEPVAEPIVQIIRDPELERRVTQLELQLMERDARIESQDSRLEMALQEVVSVMRKLRSVATRAEAASAMAETDVALQAIGNSSRGSPELKQATRLMRQSSEEFKRENYGGALFLANQAKTAVRLYGLGGSAGERRPNEVLFAAPVRLSTSKRANVREGPGTKFKVSFISDAGASLSGLSYVDEWIRVINEPGREGWIYAPLVVRRKDSNP